MENFRLKVFRAVAEALSFRKGAEMLHLSQPAVSQQIRALEEEVGTRLFDRAGGDRHNSQIALTEAGRLLLDYARRSAILLLEAERALAALNHEVTGELKLGASTTVAQYFLPRILGAFLKQYPQVHISMISGNTEHIAEAVADEKVDLGIIEGPALRRDLKTECMTPDELVLIVSPLHEWAQRKTALAAPDLTTSPLLMRERGSGSRTVVERALRQAGLRQRELNIVMELDSTEAIISGVEAGLGAGFVSRWAISKVLRLGAVKVIKVTGLRITREFRFVWPAGAELSGTAESFHRFAQAATRQEG